MIEKESLPNGNMMPIVTTWPIHTMLLDYPQAYYRYNSMGLCGALLGRQRMELQLGADGTN